MTAMSAPGLTVSQRPGLFIDFVKMAAPGLILEFGVAGGSSIISIANTVPDRPVYGFDTFDGLPEDWTEDNGTVALRKGSFACRMPSQLPSNVWLVKGLFQETLPPFLDSRDDRIAFVHIDCDLYSSTKFVLETLGWRLDGAIVVFDEIIDAPVYEQHEGRALHEFLQATGIDAQFLGRHHANGAGYRFLAS